MARQLRVLGAGYDPRRGLFVSVEQIGLVDPVGRVYLTPHEVIRLIRSLTSALQQWFEAVHKKTAPESADTLPRGLDNPLSKRRSS